jgi:hypothetical protein
MIPNLFNPKINNKVVEKTCLSNLEAKYHIAQCFFFPIFSCCTKSGN